MTIYNEKGKLLQQTLTIMDTEFISPVTAIGDYSIWRHELWNGDYMYMGITAFGAMHYEIPND